MTNRVYEDLLLLNLFSEFSIISGTYSLGFTSGVVTNLSSVKNFFCANLFVVPHALNSKTKLLMLIITAVFINAIFEFLPSRKKEKVNYNQSN